MKRIKSFSIVVILTVAWFIGTATALFTVAALLTPPAHAQTVSNLDLRVELRDLEQSMLGWRSDWWYTFGGKSAITKDPETGQLYTMDLVDGVRTRVNFEPLPDLVRGRAEQTDGVIVAESEATRAAIEDAKMALMSEIAAIEAGADEAFISGVHEATRTVVAQEHGTTRTAIEDAKVALMNEIAEEHGATRTAVTEEHEATRTAVTEEHEATRTAVTEEHEATRSYVTRTVEVPVLDDEGEPVLDDEGQPTTRTETVSRFDYVDTALAAAAGSRRRISDAVAAEAAASAAHRKAEVERWEDADRDAAVSQALDTLRFDPQQVVSVAAGYGSAAEEHAGALGVAWNANKHFKVHTVAGMGAKGRAKLGAGVTVGF